MSNTTNISPVVSPDILKVISTSTAIKTFGAQTKDKNKETTIIGDQTKTAELSKTLGLDPKSRLTLEYFQDGSGDEEDEIAKLLKMN